MPLSVIPCCLRQSACVRCGHLLASHLHGPLLVVHGELHLTHLSRSVELLCARGGVVKPAGAADGVASPADGAMLSTTDLVTPVSIFMLSNIILSESSEMYSLFSSPPFRICLYVCCAVGGELAQPRHLQLYFISIHYYIQVLI